MNVQILIATGNPGKVREFREMLGDEQTPDGRKLYTANGPSNNVSVLDAQTMQVLKTVPAGELPWGVVFGKAP